MSHRPSEDNTTDLHLIVPGDPETLTGGFIYDRKIASELGRRGWNVQVTGLNGRFPEANDAALRSTHECLSSIDDGSVVVMDGLALGAVPDISGQHATRLELIGLVHHPLGDESGLSADCRKLYHAREKEALLVARGVIVTSKFTAARLRQLGIRTEVIRVATPGVSPAPLARERIGKGRNLLCVATVTRRKRHDVLLRALSKLKEVDWTLTCVGDVERSETWARGIVELCHQVGIADRVTFTGTLSNHDLTAAYATADLFVLASEYEGFGMVFTEALARGLPVVGTTGGAIPETVPGDAGVLVPPADVEAFRDALSSLLGDDEQFRHVKSGAMAARGKLMTWKMAGRNFDLQLRELLVS